MIYEEFIGEEDVDEQLAAVLPAILFAREIRCDDPHIAGVVVRHRQLQQEETAAFVNGRAMIAVFTAQPQIFLDGSAWKALFLLDRLYGTPHGASGSFDRKMPSVCRR